MITSVLIECMQKLKQTSSESKIANYINKLKIINTTKKRMYEYTKKDRYTALDISDFCMLLYTASLNHTVDGIDIVSDGQIVHIIYGPLCPVTSSSGISITIDNNRFTYSAIISERGGTNIELHYSTDVIESDGAITRTYSYSYNYTNFSKAKLENKDNSSRMKFKLQNESYGMLKGVFTLIIEKIIQGLKEGIRNEI